MSYTPLYISEARIEALTQVTIESSNTVPTSAQLLVWIEDVESRIVDRALGSHTATDQYVDVSSGSVTSGRYQWTYYVGQDRLKVDLPSGILVPLQGMKSPMIGVTSLEKNDSAFTAAPSWTELTEWDGSTGSTDFLLMQSGLKDLGYALWFYDNEPLTGPKRLKMTYTYGYNIDADVLADYCTNAVAIQVYRALKNSNAATGMRGYDGGDLGDYIPRNYDELIQIARVEMMKIEIDHFPNRVDQGFEVV